MRTSGYSVDLVELDGLARAFRAVSRDAQDAVAWKFSVSLELLPEGDPLRHAVAVYQQSLRGALDRLCAGVDRIADSLDETVTTYVEVEASTSRALRTTGSEGE